MENKVQQCCDNLRKVAVVEVYKGKTQVQAYGFMAGDRNTPQMEVRFKETFGETNLETCKLRYVIIDDVGSLIVGEVAIGANNTGIINLPNQLFAGERRMKVQLTLASCDGSKILNLQQFTDLKVINNLTPEIAQPVYDVLINKIYDLSEEAMRVIGEGIKGLGDAYAKSKASLEDYLITAQSGGNADFLRGYLPTDFNRVEGTIAELQASRKYKLGEVVDILGYYSAGDGSNHKRKIEATDDGSGVQLANGLWGNIVHNGEVNVSWFGAKEKALTYSSLRKNSVKTLNVDIVLAFLDFSDSWRREANKFVVKFTKNQNDLTIKNAQDLTFQNLLCNDLTFICLWNTSFDNCDIYSNVHFINEGGFADFFIHNYFNHTRIFKSIKIDSTVKGLYFKNCLLTTGGGIGGGVKEDYLIYDNVIGASHDNMVFECCDLSYSTKAVVYTVNNSLPLTFRSCYLDSKIPLTNKIYISGLVLYECKMIGEGSVVQTPAKNSQDIKIKNCTSDTINLVTVGGFVKKVYNFKNGENLSAVKQNIFLKTFKTSANRINTNQFYATGVGTLNTETYYSLCFVSNVTKLVEVTIGINEKYKTYKIDLKNGELYFLSFGSEEIISAEKYDISFTFDSNVNLDLINMSASNSHDNSYTYPYFNYWTDGTKQINDIIEELKDMNEEVNISFEVNSATYPQGVTGRINGFLNKLSNSNIFYINWYQDGKLNFLLIDTNSIVMNGVYNILNSIQQLDTPYHVGKMKTEGVYTDFISYMDEKTAYDNHMRNQDTVEGTSNLNIIEEPQPSEALLKFKEKYLG